MGSPHEALITFTLADLMNLGPCIDGVRARLAKLDPVPGEIKTEEALILFASDAEALSWVERASARDGDGYGSGYGYGYG